ncbi:hypothetical protein L6241_02985 [Janibacter sp. Y6]|uniref:DNA-3-methyladenine glycosylase n=1 Tax=Janibacter sp. Y6 TaxID=2913552 RepID=UPI0034A536D1
MPADRDTPDRVGGPVTVETTLRYEPPLDWQGLLDWYRYHSLDGVEVVDDDRYRLALALPHGSALVELRDDPGQDRLDARLELADAADHDAAVAVLRRMLDLDTDPAEVDAHLRTVPVLAPLVARRPGIRLPGTPTPFEAVLRAVTGQQVSVAAGLTQLHRLVAEVGTPSAQVGALQPFPGPAAVHPFGTGWYYGTRSRRRALEGVLDLAADGGLDPGLDPEATGAALHAVWGVGAWTVASTLMRGHGAADVDLRGDRALVVALERLTREVDLPGVLRPASPWRSYAALHLWTARPLGSR